VPLHLVALAFDASDPARLAPFWAGVLGREMVEEPDGGIVLLPSADTEFRIEFYPTDAPKHGPNQMHFDLTSSSLEDQQATVARALELGGRHLDIGQGDVGHVVLADPDGNEFCVIEPGNNWLAGTGFLGELAADGTREVGVFWAAALDWPLVWDEDGETAISPPGGGHKVAWGGPPLNEYSGRHRMHFDLVASGDLDAEVERLVGLGAAMVERRGAEVEMSDPDGNELVLRSA
jgi:predicted enzyme related to lactoylglutathione lyase